MQPRTDSGSSLSSHRHASYRHFHRSSSSIETEQSDQMVVPHAVSAVPPRLHGVLVQEHRAPPRDAPSEGTP